MSLALLAGDVAGAAPPEARVPRPRPEQARSDQADPAPAGEASAEAAPVAMPPAAAAQPAATENSATAEAATAGFRLPRARPEPGAARVAKLVGDLFHFGFVPDLQMRAAISAFDAGQYANARALAAEHSDPVALKLVEWMIAREQNSGMSAAEIIKVIRSHSGWPDMDRLRLQAERAFHATGPDHNAVLAFYSHSKPRSIGGRLALAGAIRESGRAAEAAGIAREIWREEDLSDGQARTIVTRFGTELTPDDHLYRFRRLVLERQSSDAAAQAQFLGPEHAKLARAVIAVFNRDSNAAALLKGVAAKFAADPLYVIARVRMLRRADEPLQAARLLLGSEAESKVAGDAGAWWDERRDLSRDLLDAGKPDLAYQVVTGHRATSDADRAEADFHAGWYALRFLNKPEVAEPHFRELTELASMPRTRARAAYWLGRNFEAKGEQAAARVAYGGAVQFGGTFYGQLAREKLGLLTTGLERAPPPSALDRLRFAGRDPVKAIHLLAAAGYSEKAFPFFRGLAERVEEPGEVTLLTGLARRIEQPRAGMNAAAVAEQRGLQVASLPAPFLSIPAALPLPDRVDRALVYAVARQESAFNHQATSHVGARGLMQLMPETARATARSAQLPFSVQRLTSDPLYNATLGAEHLDELLRRLDQSYILTFVGYNAGPGRARDWVKAYGDPRGGAADPVDWIERIPFDETRNYVQKVMENLQIYRSRIGHPLSLSRDLVRGGSQG